jgi:transketolase
MATMMANAIRALAMDAVEKAQSGHPGMPMGMADVATVLFSECLQYHPTDPKWPNRDRFILSAGHGSMLQYALLYLLGYPDIDMEDLKQFRQFGAKTAGHPEYGELLGIETTTGPLGQGFANGVGMAIAERHLNAQFGNIIHHRTFVIAGDGCLMEGISHEAASIAAHLKLNNLVVLWDDNRISIDGSTDLAVSEDTLARFRAYGWSIQAVDGHDMQAVASALANTKEGDKPHLIACRTTIGYGAPKKAGTASCHGSPLGDTEVQSARAALGWHHAPFEIPEDVLQSWRQTGLKGTQAYQSWQEAYRAMEPAARAALEQALSGALPEGWQAGLIALKQSMVDAPKPEATRKASGRVLKALTALIPNLMGGSADLTGSNDTLVSGQEGLQSNHYGGHYLYYGVREHAMAAIMNGLALHGGVIPYAGTFLVFADYCRPAIRLSALMKQRVIYVMTHDSIGLGEDGPTHQPVEHLASLRAIPNLWVYRPADAVETLECWQLSLEAQDAPSLLALTRHNIPTLRTPDHAAISDNLSRYGAYILADTPAGLAHQVTLCATGSEVHIAREAQQTLQAKNIGARLVSFPCVERFLSQPRSYQDQILGNPTIMCAVEAAISLGWERVIGKDGIFIGMRGFGASAPYEQLYEHFGITPHHIVQQVMDRL